MTDEAARIAENVARVRGRIADAAARSGRPASQITLVAVTKYVSAAMVRPLIAAGCIDLGESRPQQLWEKAAALGDLPVRWHLIGHLQRNKVRRTLPLVTMIHSVDSPRLLAASRGRRGAGRHYASRSAGGEHLGRNGQAGLRAGGDRAFFGRKRPATETWRFAG